MTEHPLAKKLPNQTSAANLRSLRPVLCFQQCEWMTDFRKPIRGLRNWSKACLKSPKVFVGSSFVRDTYKWMQETVEEHLWKTNKSIESLFLFAVVCVVPSCVLKIAWVFINACQVVHADNSHSSVVSQIFRVHFIYCSVILCCWMHIIFLSWNRQIINFSIKMINK